jgi:hypothetical protein
MDAGTHIDSALMIALRDQSELHRKWIVVRHALIGRYGVANFRVAADARIDLLLRQLESELTTRMREGTEEAPESFCFDMQVALSEHWLMSCYEIIRSCCQFARNREMSVPKLKALRDQLSLVRTPLAKYEIDKTRQKKPKIELVPVPVSEGADNSPRLYDTDGSYILPKGVCQETGAIVWYPIDIKKQETVVVCRRDLSDAMLALFD